MGQSRWRTRANAAKKREKRDPAVPANLKRVCFVQTLPEELTEYLCTLLASLKDRLHLALCCKTLCRIVIPVHLDSYCHLRLDPFQAGIWEYLELGGKDRLARVSLLEIVAGPHSRAFILPMVLPALGVLDPARKRDAQYEEMVQVISSMRNLRTFRYEMHRSWRDERTQDLPIEVWTALQSLPLTTVDVQVHISLMLENSASIWRFANLTTFSLSREEVDAEFGILDGSNLLTMLVEFCPLLHTLVLKLARVSLTPIFLHGNWPKLRYLDCEGYTVDQEGDGHLEPTATSAFFLRHRALTHLRLLLSMRDVDGRLDDYLYITIPFANLPHLMELHTPNLNLLSNVSTECLRRIKHMGMMTLTGKNLARIHTHMPALRTLAVETDTYTVETVKGIYRGLPLTQIQKLGASFVSSSSKDMDTWCSFFTTFPNLTHLGVFRFYHVDHLVERFLGNLAAVLPKLRYVGCAGGQWYEKQQYGRWTVVSYSYRSQWVQSMGWSGLEGRS